MDLCPTGCPAAASFDKAQVLGVIGDDGRAGGLLARSLDIDSVFSVFQASNLNSPKKFVF